MYFYEFGPWNNTIFHGPTSGSMAYTGPLVKLRTWLENCIVRAYILRNYAHFFLRAWSVFLLIHIRFTPSEGPKDFVKCVFLVNSDHGKGHLPWSDFMVHGVIPASSLKWYKVCRLKTNNIPKPTECTTCIQLETLGASKCMHVVHSVGYRILLV